MANPLIPVRLYSVCYDVRPLGVSRWKLIETYHRSWDWWVYLNVDGGSPKKKKKREEDRNRWTRIWCNFIHREHDKGSVLMGGWCIEGFLSLVEAHLGSRHKKWRELASHPDYPWCQPTVYSYTKVKPRPVSSISGLGMVVSGRRLPELRWHAHSLAVEEMKKSRESSG